MCAAISRSETLAPSRWSDGKAAIAFAAAGDGTRLRDLYQSDPCRVLFPRPAHGAPIEAVIVTTSGGIVGSDRIGIDIEAGPESSATAMKYSSQER